MKYTIARITFQALFSLVASFVFTMVFFSQVGTTQMYDIFFSVAGLTFLMIAYCFNTKSH